MREQIMLRQRHAIAAATGGVAAVGKLGLTHAEFNARLSGFDRYCPVTWSVEQRLALCGGHGGDVPPRYLNPAVCPGETRDVREDVADPGRLYLRAG